MIEDSKLVIAISSRALFDLIESHQVFEGQGVDVSYPKDATMGLARRVSVRIE